MRSDTNLVKDIIRRPWAFPGGYPKYAITSDGAALCPTCCSDNYRAILESIRDYPSDQFGYCDGWRVIATDINWEDQYLTCDHCGDKIESAYGEN